MDTRFLFTLFYADILYKKMSTENDRIARDIYIPGCANTGSIYVADRVAVCCVLGNDDD